MLLTYSVFGQTDDNSNETELKKIEVGGQFTVLQQRSFNEDSVIFDNPNRFTPPLDAHQTEFGFGGRFTYNFNKNIAVETEINFFPVDRLSSEATAEILGSNAFVRVFIEPAGRKLQVVAGPKIGYRGKRIGVFGKIRPGIFYVDRFRTIFELTPNFASARGQKKVFPSLDVGGVVELYPSKRTILRFDVGDTIIRYTAQEPKQFNPAFTRHTFQFSTGFGFRF